MNAERLLVLWLRFAGGVCLLGMGGLLLPRSLMAETHELLGLGAFPAGPLTEYLARFASALCALFGGLLLLLANGVRRYRPAVLYLAVGLPVVSTAVTLFSPLDGRFAVYLMIDAVCCWVFGLVALLLLRGVPVGRVEKDGGF